MCKNHISWQRRALGWRVSERVWWTIKKDRHLPGGLHYQIKQKHHRLVVFQSCYDAEDGGRTRTVVTYRRILSPVRLPIPPPRHIHAVFPRFTIRFMRYIAWDSELTNGMSCDSNQAYFVLATKSIITCLSIWCQYIFYICSYPVQNNMSKSANDNKACMFH